MFTGLVADMGLVCAIERRDHECRFTIETGLDARAIAVGDSILHSGVCLTVVDCGRRKDRTWFAVEAVAETLSRTTLGDWKPGTRINLELSLTPAQPLGGHFVFGHVDAAATVMAVCTEGESWRLTICPPPPLVKFFACKGSVALDGVSLTIADILPGGDFQVVIIPHTWQVTTLSGLQPGSRVNLEVDMLARYVARMIGPDDVDPLLTPGPEQRV